MHQAGLQTTLCSNNPVSSTKYIVTNHQLLLDVLLIVMCIMLVG